MDITAEEKNELNAFLNEHGFNRILGMELTSDIANQSRNNGATPLLTAILRGHTRIVELLVSSGANVNQASNDGSTPLWVAARNNYTGITDLLLNNGAEVNQANNNGITPLLAAALDGHTRIVELLLENGVDVNQAHNNGYTTLHSAALDGYTRIAELLVDRGANINQTSNDGYTPLHDAAENGHTRIVELLLRNGANINQNNNDGNTPLHVAAENRHTRIAELLVDRGANINQTSNDGYTPLHVAAENGHTRIVELLLRNGANINQNNNDGRTPLLDATKNNHIETVKLLLFAARLSDAEIPDNINTDPIIARILACNPTILKNNLKSIAEDMQNDSWKKEAYRIALDYLYKNFQADDDLAGFLQKFTAKTAPNEINKLVNKEKQGFIDNLSLSKKQDSSYKKNHLLSLPDVISAELAECLGPTSNPNSTRLQNSLEAHFSRNLSIEARTAAIVDLNELTLRLNALYNNGVTLSQNRSNLPENVERTDDGEYKYYVDPENGGAAMVERRLNDLNLDQLRQLTNLVEQREREVAETSQNQSHVGRLATQRNSDQQKGGGRNA